MRPGLAGSPHRRTGDYSQSPNTQIPPRLLIVVGSRYTRDITVPHTSQSPVRKEGVLPSIRFSIAALMGLVLVAAIGLAALRNGCESWAGVMLLLTCGVLALAVVGVFCGRLRAVLVAWVCNLRLGLPGSCVLVLESLWAAETADSGLARALATKLGLTPNGVGFGSGMGGVGGGMRTVDTYALQPVFGAVEFGGGLEETRRDLEVEWPTRESVTASGRCSWPPWGHFGRAPLFRFL